MNKQVDVDKVRDNFDALLDEVENGSEIEILRHGTVIARLSRISRSPVALRGKFAGIAKTNATDDELFSTGVEWAVTQEP